MRCYYEVLNVPRDAEDGDIKSAYKKLALRWHPDKNLSNPDEAKEQFQLVQQAYEVLSDRQERAWYDNHREQILHGSNKDFEDNCLDVFQYFTSSCYKGFSDDDAAFYAVYRNLFEQIAKEDMEHMDNKEEFTTIPMFGKADSDYETLVRPFYAYWMSYSTKRSYVWLDPYDIKETRDRRVIKLIEKENKKVRAKAKKERNDEVRNLVAFVKKRDKRVQANVKYLEQKAKDNKVRAQELALQARRERQAESKNDVQGEWSKFDNVQEELENIEKQLAEQFDDFDDEDASEEEANDLYCVACNKVFKTPKAFANHESSKKHKENIEKLKEEMLEEEDEFETIDDEVSIDGSIDVDDLELPKNSSEKNGKAKCECREDPDDDHVCDECLSDVIREELEELEEETAKTKKKKNKKAKQNKNILNNSDDEALEPSELNVSSTSKIQDTVVVEPEQDCNGGDVEDDTSEISAGAGKLSQKKPKRRKEKKTKSTSPATPNDACMTTGNNGNNIDLEHTCVTCKNIFSSKNKLFDHLKKTGHGVYIAPEEKSKQKEVNKGKGKRGKREERRKRGDDSD